MRCLFLLLLHIPLALDSIAPAVLHIRCVLCFLTDAYKMLLSFVLAHFLVILLCLLFLCLLYIWLRVLFSSAVLLSLVEPERFVFLNILLICFVELRYQFYSVIYSCLLLSDAFSIIEGAALSVIAYYLGMLRDVIWHCVLSLSELRYQIH